MLTAVVISVLVCLKKRKKKEPKLMDNIASHSQNMELKANRNSDYTAVSSTILTTTKPYAATPVYATPQTAEAVQASAKGIDTKHNAAYAATAIVTAVNEAYQPVQSTNTLASRTLDTAIPTTTNEAYAATNIIYATPQTAEAVQASAKGIDTKHNAAYAATGIATAVNEAYQPVQSTNTLASRTLDTAIPTTTNEAYAATNIIYATPQTAEAVQASAKGIDTKPNAAYAATGIATSVNEAYQPVQSSNAQASRTLVTAIPTTTNEAYAATNIIYATPHTAEAVQASAKGIDTKPNAAYARGEANMLKILPIILFHSAHKLSLLFL